MKHPRHQFGFASRRNERGLHRSDSRGGAIVIPCCRSASAYALLPRLTHRGQLRDSDRYSSACSTVCPRFLFAARRRRAAAVRPAKAASPAPRRASAWSATCPTANGICRPAITRTRASARSSQINGGNVAKLRMISSFSTGIPRGHEGQPLVVGSTMYMVTPYPNLLYAFDLAQPNGPVEVGVRPASRFARRSASPAATS